MTFMERQDSPDIEMVCIAFEMRQPDAMERAERLREYLVGETMKAMETVELQQNTIESGRDVHLRESKTSIIGYETIDIISASERNIERALELIGKASRVSDLIEQHGKKRLRDDIVDPGPTTEMLYQLRNSRNGDPVLRLNALYRKTGRGLNDDHVRSACEIASVVHFITNGLGALVSRLPVKSDEGDDLSLRSRTETWIDTMERMALLHAKVFRPWSQRNKSAVKIVLGLVVEGESLRALRRRYRMRWEKALNKLVGALDDYAVCRKHFRKTGKAIAS